MKCAWETESDKPIEKKRPVLIELATRRPISILFYFYFQRPHIERRAETDEKEMPDKQVYCLNTFTKQVV